MSIKVYMENNSTIPTEKKWKKMIAINFTIREICVYLLYVKSSKELHLRWHRYVINKIRLL